MSDLGAEEVDGEVLMSNCGMLLIRTNHNGELKFPVGLTFDRNLSAFRKSLVSNVVETS
jgi:hypothetical protein